MTPILITIFVTLPIIALGTWLYLRRRKLSPRMRIGLMWLFFLFFLLSGPAVLVLWYTDRHSGMVRFPRFLGQVVIAWVIGTLITGGQLWRLCRNKGEI